MTCNCWYYELNNYMYIWFFSLIFDLQLNCFLVQIYPSSKKTLCLFNDVLDILFTVISPWSHGKGPLDKPNAGVTVTSPLHHVEPSWYMHTANSSDVYFSFQPVLHDWCNKGCGMCYPVCGMMHIKEPLLLIGKSSPCGGSGFPFSLSEWSFTICLMPYNRKIKCVECIVE